MVQQAKEDVATGYHKEGTPEWHRDQFLISLEDLTDDDAVKELNDMYREELETLQSSEVDPKTGQPIKKTWKDQLEIPTAAVTMLRQLTGALRGSGGRHTRAEHGYLDRRGSKVHHKGVDIPGKGKKGNKYTASFVDPTAPTVRPSRDISTVPDDEEGRRLPEIPLSAAEIGAKEVQAVSDEYRDRLERSKRAAKITGTVTRGAKADDKLPPLVKPARLRPTAPSEGPPELPPEAYDPESPEEKLRKKLADLKKQLMGVDTKLTEIARFSTADHTPNWYDDL
jgi:hypothetical protein